MLGSRCIYYELRTLGSSLALGPFEKRTNLSYLVRVGTFRALTGACGRVGVWVGVSGLSPHPPAWETEARGAVWAGTGQKGKSAPQVHSLLPQRPEAAPGVAVT